MVRQSFGAVALVALRLARGPGCGDLGDPEGGPNAPCTRSSDCGGALVCSAGVCREPGDDDDASRDSGSEGEPPAPGLEDAGDAGS
ncbi:MAG: hypothetical protein KIS78_03725 [Labilithrix sp.]|nr:hypothetical protein [Labilithrix sp.]